MVEFFVFLSALLSVAAVCADLYLTLKKNPSLVTVCSVFFAVFFVLPIGLDCVFGLPAYLRYPGFYAASRDPGTRATYAGFLLFTSLFFLFARRYAVIRLPKKGTVVDYLICLSGRVRNWRWGIAGVCLLPLVALMFAPHLEFYSTYAMQYRGHRLQSPDVRIFHTYLQLLCHLGILSAGLFLAVSGRDRSSYLFSIIVWGALAWLIGKRHAVAEIAVVLLIAMALRGRFRLIRVFVVATGLLVAVLGYSAWYQSFARGISVVESDSDLVYDDLRVDYFRDDVVQLALFNELNSSGCHTLDYRGESLWIYASLPVPRVLWSQKPTSYGTAMMCSALRRPRSYLGYSMTTSIFDEAVSNFGFVGVFFAPLILVAVARFGAISNSLPGLLLTVMVELLFFVQHLSAWMPVFLIWLLFISRRQGHRAILVSRDVEKIHPRKECSDGEGRRLNSKRGAAYAT